MITDAVDALTRPAAYARFRRDEPKQIARYIAFLSLLLVGCLAASLRLRVVPVFDDTLHWLETSMPVLRFANGKVDSDLRGPLRLENPRDKRFAILIDLARKEPVTAQTMTDEKVAAVLTQSTLYFTAAAGPPQILDLSRATAQPPFTLDASVYGDLRRAFYWVFFPVVLLIAFILSASAVATYALGYGLIGVSVSKYLSPVPYFDAMRIGVYAQTAGALIRGLEFLLPFAIPYSTVIVFCVGFAYTLIGINGSNPLSAAP